MDITFTKVLNSGSVELTAFRPTIIPEGYINNRTLIGEIILTVKPGNNLHIPKALSSDEQPTISAEFGVSDPA